MRFGSLEEVSIRLENVKNAVNKYQETNNKAMRNFNKTLGERETEGKLYEKSKETIGKL